MSAAGYISHVSPVTASRLAAVAIALSVVGCGAAKPRPAQTPEAAVQNFWEGFERNDADRFCASIVGQAYDGTLEVPSPAGCRSDFRSGAFRGAMPENTRFVKTLSVIERAHGRRDVTFSVVRGASHRTATLRVVRVRGAWRVVILGEGAR
jgi:hypothetical protein